MRTVYANALLSDGEILFWYTGDECKSWHDFYKDFYYAGLHMVEYEKSHELKLVKVGFIDPTDEWDYSDLIFYNFAKDKNISTIQRLRIGNYYFQRSNLLHFKYGGRTIEFKQSWTSRLTYI